MKRGVVMSVNKKHAIVMTADGQFLRAPISGKAQIGEEVTFEEEYKLARTFKPVFRYSGAAAVVLLFMLPMLLFFGRDAHPVVAYLSMDINPSIEIGVDKEDKVRELRALNEDGERIIQGLSYKGMKVEDVAASILQQAKGSHYLDLPNRDIFITSVLLSGKNGLKLDYETILAKKVDEAVRGLLAELPAEAASVNVTTLSVPHEVRDAAAANGISAGKMAVYLMAKEEGYKLEIEQIQKQSITKATEPIGGVKAIVDQAADKSKEKLKQLVAQEKKEKAKRQKDEQKAAKATPAATVGAKKPDKAEKPEKPVSSKRERDEWRDRNGDRDNKPSDRKFADESRRDGERDDKDRERGRDRSGNDDDDNDDDNDGGDNDRRKVRNDGDDDEDRNGNGGNGRNRDDDRDNKQGNDRNDSRDYDKNREFDEDSVTRRNESGRDERNSREKRDN